MISVRLPDGSEVDVPTNDAKQAAAAAQKHWATKSQNGPGGTVGAAIGNIVDNITPNWGDEVAGAARWLHAKVDGRDAGAAFAEGQRDFKAQQARYKAEHPKLAAVTSLTGLGLGMVAPTGRVAEGASMAARMAHGAAVGAGYGAVSGFGQGDGLAARTGNAAAGATTGAFLGAVASPAISAAGKVGRFIGNTVPGAAAVGRSIRNVPAAIWKRPRATPETDARDAAGRLLLQRSNEGHIATGFGQTGAAASPEAIVAEQQRRAAMGVPALPGDITDPLRGLTSWASRGMGPGQTRVRQVLDARKAQEAGRVRQHVIDTLGDAVDPHLTLEQHMAQASAVAAPAYRAAYNQPMVVTPEIESIMATPAFQDALPHAVRNIRNAQRDPHALGFRLDRVGNLASLEGLSTEGFDQVIRAMRESGQAAMDTSGFRPRDTTNSIHINARARDLRGHLMEQNEPYREAVTNWGDDMAQADAFKAGQDILGVTGHEINDQARHMPNTANAAWSLGARSALADEASRFGARYPTGNTAGRVRQALGDETKQDAIGRLSGNTGAVRGLQDRLEAEHQGNLLWNDVQGNSKTAQRQQADSDTEALLGNFNLGDIRPMRFAERTLTNLAAGLGKKRSQAVKAEVSNFLTESDPAEVARLYGGFLDAARRRDEHRALMDQIGLRGVRAGMSKWEAPDPGAGYDVAR